MPDLETIGIIVGIVAGIIVIWTSLSNWGRSQYKKIWSFFTRYRPKVPKETIRLIPQYHHNHWNLGSSKGEPAMQVVCDWYITNISDVDILICGVSLRKPKTIGHISVRHEKQNIYGSYPILRGHTTEARADFWIQPPICKEDEELVVDIDFVDQFGNSHRVRKVKFRPVPKKKEEKIASQMETVSDISNIVEREIVAVLKAEINHYKRRGREVGGLGSILTTLPEHGFGFNSKRIKSDNASTLVEFYHSLNSQQKKDFVENLLKRLSRESPYAPVGYFILFVLYHIGFLNKALKTAKEELQGDSAHGFSDFLRLLDRLLQYEPQGFSTEMIDNIEQFLKGIEEHTFRISERLLDIRTTLLAGKVEKEKDRDKDKD